MFILSSIIKSLKKVTKLGIDSIEYMPKIINKHSGLRKEYFNYLNLFIVYVDSDDIYEEKYTKLVSLT